MGQLAEWSGLKVSPIANMFHLRLEQAMPGSVKVKCSCFINNRNHNIVSFMSPLLFRACE